MEATPAPASPSSTPTPRLVKVEPATKDEVENFISANNRWIEDSAALELRNMPPEDQRRVINGGTLVSCRDAVGVMRSRVRQAKEKEAILSGAHLAENATASSGRLSRPASKDEVEAFIAANRRWMTPESEEIMKLMNPHDQKRVISAGTLSGCRDPVAVLQTRAKRAREMEIEFELIASGKKVEPPKPAAETMPMPVFSAEAAHAFIHAAPQEVRSENSRFAPPPEADPDSFVTEELEGPLTGEVKGIGGVIEMLRAKYGCSKGQRLRVIGETPALLQFEGGKTAPKNHEGTGWKWIMGEGNAASKQKDEAVRQAEIAAAFKAREERLAQEAIFKAKEKEKKAADKAERAKQKETGDKEATEGQETENEHAVGGPAAQLAVPKEEAPTEAARTAMEVERSPAKKEGKAVDKKDKGKQKDKDKEDKKPDKNKQSKEKDKVPEPKKEDKGKEKSKKGGKADSKTKEKENKGKEPDEPKEKKEKDKNNIMESNKDSEKNSDVKDNQKEKSQAKDRSRSKSRQKNTSRSKDKDKDKKRDRSRSRSRDRQRNKQKERSRSKDKDKQKAKEKDRSKGDEKAKRKRSSSSNSTSRSKRKAKARAKEKEKRSKKSKSDDSSATKKRDKEHKRRRRSSSS